MRRSTSASLFTSHRRHACQVTAQNRNHGLDVVPAAEMLMKGVLGCEQLWMFGFPVRVWITCSGQNVQELNAESEAAYICTGMIKRAHLSQNAAVPGLVPSRLPGHRDLQVSLHATRLLGLSARLSEQLCYAKAHLQQGEVWDFEAMVEGLVHMAHGS